jgi:[protein-PII] uridylyltransferase
VTGNVVPPPVVSPESAALALASRAADVEHRVHQAWARFVQPSFPSGVALAATGGFGRAELFPHSDVDLLIAVESEPQIESLRSSVSAFLQSLWDSGLRPSHAVQTVAYCAAEHEDNVELTISLLDRRRLAGDPAMYTWLDERVAVFLERQGAGIARTLVQRTAARHEKYQDTIYHLEPNLKDTPGALRDLQTVRWLSALLHRESADDLRAAFAFLAALRARLHEAAGRDQNVLSFDAQESMSDDPAQLMRSYYRHARLVDRALDRAIDAVETLPGTLLNRFHEWRSRLSTPDFTVSRDRVLLRNPSQLSSGLALFEFAARHQLRLAPSTADRIGGIPIETTWDDWRALLSLPKPSAGLRAMQNAGALAGAIPEWRYIECLVVRDFYHRYTVDEHSLVAIASLENIGDARFADLFSEIEDPWLIRFALLMHDIGKGSGNDHVEESLRIAKGVLSRLRAPDADRAAIEFLIARHLELSTVMSSRDLHDRATAALLASRLGTVERLKQLVILTYADISAVNPESMTPWRLEQLWQVYLLAHAELTRGLDTERIHEAGGESPDRAAFLEGLPVRYLRTHSEEQIAAHLDMARQLDARPVAIDITHDRRVYQLTLLTRDRAGLFAAVAGALSGLGMSIVKAEAFSNARGVIVDTFTFADPHRTLELNPSEIDRVRGIIRRVVEGKQDAAQLLRARPKPPAGSRGAQLKPRVRLTDDASESSTLVEIVAQDRPGLLYSLAHAISEAGCNIEVVLIDTEAHKALDVFYVTSNGRKLTPELARRLEKDLLAAC